jgi:RNA polymerase sigma factor (sigma-70 family)
MEPVSRRARLAPVESELGDARFTELFELHGPRVLAYALRRTTSTADAEDVAAETFVVAWRRRTEIPEDPLPWLYGVARRVLANQRRGTVRRFRALLRLERPDPAPARLGEEEGPAIAALARLSADDQELLRLVAWEELTHAQIASVLGISVNAVAIRLHRARARFAAAYGAMGAEPKGSAHERTQRSVKGRLTGKAQEGSR